MLTIALLIFTLPILPPLAFSSLLPSQRLVAVTEALLFTNKAPLPSFCPIMISFALKALSWSDTLIAALPTTAVISFTVTVPLLVIESSEGCPACVFSKINLFTTSCVPALLTMSFSTKYTSSLIVVVCPSS